jgi:glycosyltransferase 2 family protein
VQFSIKNLISFLLSFSLGFIILYFVFKQQQGVYESTCDLANDPYGCSLIKKTWHDFTSAKWGYILLAVMFSFLSNVIRALRWNLLTTPLGYPLRLTNSLGAILIGYFTSLALPRVGEFIRAGVIAKYEQMPTEKAFGTVILERVIDVILFALVGLLTFVVAYKDISSYLIDEFKKFGDRNKIDWNSLFSIANIFMYIIFTTVTILSVIYFRKKLLSSKFGTKVSSFFSGLFEGLTSISKLEHRTLFITYSLSIWICYFFMVFVAFFAYEPTSHLGFVPALAVLLFGSLGVVIPSPAGMGSFQYLVSKSLNIYGVSSISGFTYANLHFFAIALGSTIVFGLLSYLILPIYNSKKSVES